MTATAEILPAVADRIEPPALRSVGAITPLEMLDRAVATGASVDVMERLMAMHERWEANQARKAFDAALSAAKAEIPVIRKNRTVDFTSQKGRTNYEHEDFAEIARTVDPILARHGLSYRHRTQQGEGGLITVTCIVSHRDGHSEENSLSAGRDESGNKNNIQAIGSTTTYLQRYTLKAALGLAAGKDDDASAPTTGQVISDEDAETLRTKMEACGLSEAVFCAKMRVARVEALPASRYDEAERRIMDYSNRKAQANAG